MAFWKWFGSSRVRDKEGRPKVVYHGTDNSFSKFDSERSNWNTNTGVPKGAFVFSDNPDVSASYAAQEMGKTGWHNPKTFDEFRTLVKTGSFDQQMQFLHDHPQDQIDDYKLGGNIMPCYLRILKPVVVDAKGYHWNDIYYQPKGYRDAESFSTNEIAQIAMENGYDGCIIKNVKDVSKGPSHIATSFFVFSSAQVKSAITNSGAYNKKSGDISEDEV